MEFLIDISFEKLLLNDMFWMIKFIVDKNYSDLEI